MNPMTIFVTMLFLVAALCVLLLVSFQTSSVANLSMLLYTQEAVDSCVHDEYSPHCNPPPPSPQVLVTCSTELKLTCQNVLIQDALHEVITMQMRC